MEQGRAGGNGVYDSIALEPARNFDVGAGRYPRPRARAVIHAPYVLWHALSWRRSLCSTCTRPHQPHAAQAP